MNYKTMSFMILKNVRIVIVYPILTRPQPLLISLPMLLIKNYWLDFLSPIPKNSNKMGLENGIQNRILRSILLSLSLDSNLETVFLLVSGKDRNFWDQWTEMYMKDDDQGNWMIQSPLCGRSPGLLCLSWPIKGESVRTCHANGCDH